MAKTKTEIHVTTVFDGELDATEMCIRDRMIQKAQQLQYKLMKISCLLLEKIHK